MCNLTKQLKLKWWKYQIIISWPVKQSTTAILNKIFAKIWIIGISCFVSFHLNNRSIQDNFPKTDVGMQ